MMTLDTAFDSRQLGLLRLLYGFVFTWTLLAYLATLVWSLAASFVARVPDLDALACELALALLLTLRLCQVLNRPGFMGESEDRPSTRGAHPRCRGSTTDTSSTSGT